MCSSSFQSLQLKFKLRNGESIFPCNTYRSDSDKLYKNQKNSFDDNVFNLFLQNLDFTLCLLLGHHGDPINRHYLEVIVGAWKMKDIFFSLCVPI